MTRRALLRKIRQALEPRLYESGYRVGPLGASRPYRIAPLASPRTLGGFVVDEVEGFAEDGVVEEFYVGCVTIRWRAIPVEDLARVLRVVSGAKTRWRDKVVGQTASDDAKIETSTGSDLHVDFDISHVLEEPWCSAGVVNFLSEQMLNLVPGARDFAVSNPVAGVQGWVKFDANPTAKARRAANKRVRAVLAELIRLMKDTDGDCPGPGGDLRWHCPTGCRGDTLECATCGASGHVDYDPSGKSLFKLTSKRVVDYEMVRVYEYTGSS